MTYLESKPTTYTFLFKFYDIISGKSTRNVLDIVSCYRLCYGNIVIDYFIKIINSLNKLSLC